MLIIRTVLFFVAFIAVSADAKVRSPAPQQPAPAGARVAVLYAATQKLRVSVMQACMRRNNLKKDCHTPVTIGCTLFQPYLGGDIPVATFAGSFGEDAFVLAAVSGTIATVYTDARHDGKLDHIQILAADTGSPREMEALRIQTVEVLKRDKARGAPLSQQSFAQQVESFGSCMREAVETETRH